MFKRPNNTVLFLVAAASALVMVTSGFAEEPSRLDAEAILDAHVVATGGVEAYDAVKNRVIRAKFQVSGIELEVVTYQARPNLSHTIISSEATGTIEKGTDGNVVWEKSLMTGPVVKSGDEATLVKRSSNFDLTSHWRDFYDDVELLGVEEIHGRSCHKVRLEATDQGPVETRFFDVETGLLARADLEVTLPMGKVTMQQSLDDYREVGGLLVPYRVTQMAAGTSTVIEVQSVELNVDVEAGHFELPGDIRGLVEKEDE